jgi:hypothetical protein
MSAPVLRGRESVAHGTVAGSFASAPVNFDAKLVKANTIPEEQRGGQDVHFAIIDGIEHEEWSVRDSFVYHDDLGFWLASAVGNATSTLVETGVYSSVFKFADDPASLSLKWTQPRRATQGYQSLWCVVDKMGFTFEAGGMLKWSASGVGMPETEVTPTYTFGTVVPMTAWRGTVTFLGGAFTRLVKGTVNITRTRKPFRTINNTTAPIDFSIGNRMVDFNLVCDFNSKTAYDKFKSATPSDAVTILWTQPGLIGATKYPEFTIKLGTLGMEVGEIDTGQDFPAVSLSGKGIYNVSDASTAVFTIQSTKQYQTAVS